MIDKNQSGELSVQFLGEDGKVLTSVEDDVTFAYAITDTSIASLNVINAKNSANDFKINITNKKMGKTTMEIRLDHEGHTDYRTPFFNIETK